MLFDLNKSGKKKGGETNYTTASKTLLATFLILNTWEESPGLCLSEPHHHSISSWPFTLKIKTKTVFWEGKSHLCLSLESNLD